VWCELREKSGKSPKSPHRRFVGNCKRYFRGQRKCSGLALLHFRLYQFYQIIMEHIAGYTVALRVSNDDGVKLLRQPLFSENAVAETGIKIRNRQHHLIRFKQLVGYIICHQLFIGRLGRGSNMCFDVFANTAGKRKIFVFDTPNSSASTRTSSKRTNHAPMVMVEKSYLKLYHIFLPLLVKFLS